MSPLWSLLAPRSRNKLTGAAFMMADQNDMWFKQGSSNDQVTELRRTHRGNLEVKRISQELDLSNSDCWRFILALSHIIDWRNERKYTMRALYQDRLPKTYPLNMCLIQKGYFISSCPLCTLWGWGDNWWWMSFSAGLLCRLWKNNNHHIWQLLCVFA